MILQKFGSHAVALMAFGISLTCSGPVHAALGGDANSVVTDRMAMAVDNTSVAVSKTTRASQSINAVTDSATKSATSATSSSTNSSTSSSSSTTASTTVSATYTVEAMTTAAGTTVNEYTNANGVVFAISWSGPFIPDLRQLLGAQHFASYNNVLTQRAAATGAGAGRRPATVESDDLVVHSTGRMRAFQGFAYLRSLLPSGFTAADIQ